MFKRTMMSRLESGCSFIGSLVPKVFCTGTLTWSLWVVLTVANDQVRNQYERPTLASVFDAIAIFLYLLCVFTYYKIIVCGPGSPLDYKELIIENIYEYTSSNPYDSMSQQSPLDNPPVDIITMHNFGRKGYRYCPKCAVWKPDRAHHCSRENKCILRMDHHCPWFSICIGYFNQKFFVQFLCYIAIYAGLVLLETTVLLYEFFSKEFYAQRFLPISLVILFIIALAFAVAVSAFAGFLIYLVLLNLTTIEFQERSWNRSNNATNGSFQYQFDEAGKKAGNIYDLGYARNWRSIMGPNWLHWILPITLTNKSVHAKYLNGINYEVDAEVYEKWCYNARLQDQLNQQLAEYNLNRAER